MAGDPTCLDILFAVRKELRQARCEKCRSDADEVEARPKEDAPYTDEVDFIHVLVRSQREVDAGQLEREGIIAWKEEQRIYSKRVWADEPKRKLRARNLSA